MLLEAGGHQKLRECKREPAIMCGDAPSKETTTRKSYAEYTSVAAATHPKITEPTQTKTPPMLDPVHTLKQQNFLFHPGVNQASQRLHQR